MVSYGDHIRRFITEIDILGIDLAKHIFQLHGAERSGRAVHRSKVGRAALVEVRLVRPQYVAPFAKTNKNDRNDAEAIAEAASRPTMRFVSVKSVAQEDIQAVRRMRAILVRQRTAVINQIRGVLADCGLTNDRAGPTVVGKIAAGVHRST